MPENEIKPNSDIGAWVNSLLSGNNQALLPLLDALMYAGDPIRITQYRRLHGLLGDITHKYNSQTPKRGTLRKWTEDLKRIFWNDLYSYQYAIDALQWLHSPQPIDRHGNAVDSPDEETTPGGVDVIGELARNAGAESARRMNEEALRSYLAAPRGQLLTLPAGFNVSGPVHTWGDNRNAARGWTLQQIDAEIQRLQGQLDHALNDESVNQHTISLQGILNELEAERQRIRDERRENNY